MSAMVPIRLLRGRPKLANKKQLVSIRYSPEVIDYFGTPEKARSTVAQLVSAIETR